MIRKPEYALSIKLYLVSMIGFTALALLSGWAWPVIRVMMAFGTFSFVLLMIAEWHKTK